MCTNIKRLLDNMRATHFYVVFFFWKKATQKVCLLYNKICSVSLFRLSGHLKKKKKNYSRK